MKDEIFEAPLYSMGQECRSSAFLFVNSQPLLWLLLAAAVAVETSQDTCFVHEMKKVVVKTTMRPLREIPSFRQQSSVWATSACRSLPTQHGPLQRQTSRMRNCSHRWRGPQSGVWATSTCSTLPTLHGPLRQRTSRMHSCSQRWRGQQSPVAILAQVVPAQEAGARAEAGDQQKMHE